MITKEFIEEQRNILLANKILNDVLLEEKISIAAKTGLDIIYTFTVFNNQIDTIRPKLNALEKIGLKVEIRGEEFYELGNRFKQWIYTVKIEF